MSEPNSLTLAILPADIIRKVIRMNSAWSVDKLRFISKTWNSLVSEYFQFRPSLEWICFSEFIHRVTVVVKAKKQHFKHFACNLLHYWEVTAQEMTTATIEFTIESDDCWFLKHLFRIFMSTNHVKLLEFQNMKRQTINLICEAMSHVKIDQFDFQRNKIDEEMRNCITNIIRQHRIEDLGLVADYISGKELCKYLLSLPRFTRFIYVKVSNNLQKKPKATSRFWSLFAQMLIEKKGKSSIAMLTPNNSLGGSADRVVCYIVDSFIDFLHNFVDYV